MPVAAIPSSWLGHCLQEDTVKRVLLEMNPEIQFDLGAAHNLPHPDQSFAQGVFYRGKHICTMDRGALPEVPLWTVKEELVEIPWLQLRIQEIAMQSPFDPSKAWVMRQAKDKVLQVGWRHTFGMILSRGVPGVTKHGLEVAFGINLDPKLLDEAEVIESRQVRVVDKSISVSSA